MNISLIGMSGVGKSTIGKELAKKLNYRFIDVDRLIESTSNLKLQKLLDYVGEENFLRIEERTILDLGKLERTVISPGGSVIYSEEAMKFLKKNSKIIFLDATLESIKKRVDFSNRGIIGLKKKGPEVLFEERRRVCMDYADIRIVLSKKKFDKYSIVREIIEKI